MLIYGCTTRLYHPPIVTVTLIIVNVVAYVASASASEETLLPLVLQYGTGLHPLQWLTSIFLHADTTHLIGNMIFLWPFGLVVEGKVGWFRFLVLYLAIGIGQSAVEQTIMLSASRPPVNVLALEEFPEWRALDEVERERVLEELQATMLSGASLGASSVIFGLLAVCCIWCPTSDFNIWWRLGTVEVPVIVVGGGYIAKEALFWWIGGEIMGSPLLHVMGAIAGLMVAVIMLRFGFVDCEGDDILSYARGSGGERRARAPRAGRVGRPARTARAVSDVQSRAIAMDQETRKRHVEEKAREAQRSADLAREEIARALEASQFDAAYALIDKVRQSDPEYMPSAGEMRRLIQGMIKAKNWTQAKILMAGYLQTHEERRDFVLLQRAQLALVIDRDAEMCLNLLKKIDAKQLDEASRQLRVKLAKRCTP